MFGAGTVSISDIVTQLMPWKASESLKLYANYNPGGGGGDGTPIHKLYGDVLPFRVWFFDHPLINRISNSNIFEDFFINRV